MDTLKGKKKGIRNKYIRNKVSVAPTINKMVEYRPRWFRYMYRKFIKDSVRRVDQMVTQ